MPPKITNATLLPLDAGGDITVADFEASTGPAVVILRGDDLLLAADDCERLASELHRRTVVVAEG